MLAILVAAWLQWPLARANIPKIQPLQGLLPASTATATATEAAAHNLRKLPTACCHIFHWQWCRRVSWLAFYLWLGSGWLPGCVRSALAMAETGAKQARPTADGQAGVQLPGQRLSAGPGIFLAFAFPVAIPDCTNCTNHFRIARKFVSTVEAASPGHKLHS